AQLRTLMAKGVGRKQWTGGRGGQAAPIKLTPPEWLKTAGPNLARTAEVSVSSNFDVKKYPPRHINDGKTDVNNNDLRWVSARSVPNHVELAWDAAQTIGAVRILNGYRQGGQLTWQMHDFVLQAHDGAGWRDIPGTRTAGNRKSDWHASFAPVTTKRLRLLVTAANQDTTRIWEFEVYGRPDKQPRP
ncbi:MAG: hypothetical protein WBF17_17585, partial [Phycisphaerae bacterium]